MGWVCENELATGREAGEATSKYIIYIYILHIEYAYHLFILYIYQIYGYRYIEKFRLKYV